MEVCKICGRKFDPLPLPDFAELFGIKSPHKVICPICALKGAAEAASFAVAVLQEQEKKDKEKEKVKQG